MIPYPGTEICGCDDDALCGFHADQLLQRMQEPSISVPNAHVEPSFRDILNAMISETEMDNALIAKYEGWNEPADCACNSCVESINLYKSR